MNNQTNQCHWMNELMDGWMIENPGRALLRPSIHQSTNPPIQS
jgi:hypothetical protein